MQMPLPYLQALPQHAHSIPVINLIGHVSSLYCGASKHALSAGSPFCNLFCLLPISLTGPYVPHHHVLDTFVSKGCLANTKSTQIILWQVHRLVADAFHWSVCLPLLSHHDCPQMTEDAYPCRESTAPVRTV